MLGTKVPLCTVCQFGHPYLEYTHKLKAAYRAPYCRIPKWILNTGGTYLVIA